MEMSNRMAKANLRNMLLIGSVLAAVATGIGTAAAQPGSEFQDQGIREMNNVPAVGEPAGHRGTGAYAYAPGGHTMHHRIVRHR
jgi:hypothetical protein